MTVIKTLVPTDLKKQKDQMAKNLGVLSLIRGYVIGVEHTQIQAISPKPSWFDTLNTNLKGAQKHVKPWQTKIEPGITSNFPQSISNMASRFATGTDEILAILNTKTKDGKQYVPTAAQIQTIVNSLNWISKHINSEKSTLDGVKTDFDAFKTNSDNDYTALNDGNNSIQTAILADNKLIVKLQGDIVTDNAHIAADKAAITAAGIAAGVGLFAGVSVIGLGAASTGPAAPVVMLVGAFIIVASIAELTAVLAVYIPRLNAARTKLADDTAHLGEEQQQVASLSLMSDSISKLLDLNKQMQNSLQDLTDWFAQTTLQISTVASDISEASSDITADDWFSLKLDVIQAQKDWKALETYANQWGVAASTIVNKVVHINKDTAKAKSNAA
nr:hypothetical protein [uncultured Psychroserpens sp.]